LSNSKFNTLLLNNNLQR